MRATVLSKFSKLLIPFIVIAVFLLPGCNDTEDQQKPQGNGEEERLAEYVVADATGDWGYPTPYAHYKRGPGYVRMSFIFETLTWKDSEQITPQLAKTWEYIEEENAYIFNLREGVKWHDGEPFDASDVVFTFNYIKEHPHPFVDASVIEEVELINEHSVKMHLGNTFAPIFQNIFGTQPILPKHIWENVQNPEDFREEQAVIGTGPYKLADYSSEHGTYLYVANEDYYMGEPIAEKIKFIKMAEEVMPAALKSGEVDYIDLAPELVEQIKADGFEVEEAPAAWNAKMFMNYNKEPLSSVDFRQAIAYAIDRELLVDIAMRGFATAGSPGIMPPSSPWFNPETEQYSYSPDKAAELLEGLGYVKTGDYYEKDGSVLELSLIAATDFKEVGQFIKTSLEEIGIKVEFATLERKTVDAKVGAWDFDLSIYGHGGLYEPSILTRVITGKGFNSARYTENELLNALCEEQLVEMDTEKRKQIVFDIQQIFAYDLPTLTLYYPKWYTAHDGEADLYYTADGIGNGAPIALNRMAFVK